MASFDPGFSPKRLKRYWRNWRNPEAVWNLSLKAWAEAIARGGLPEPFDGAANSAKGWLDAKGIEYRTASQSYTSSRSRATTLPLFQEERSTASA
jgi:hypothetical protein